LAMKTPAATAMAGAKTNNNQLKAVAATVTEMATMTATTRTMKKKVTASLMAAKRRREPVAYFQRILINECPDDIE
jgi:hypothetical protein